MRLGFSQQQIIDTAKSLGLPTDGFIQRRVARAFDLVETNKVNEVTDGIFRVRSQYEADKSYIVNLNHGEPACDCPDGERTINCKHRIASLLWMRKHEAKAFIIKEIERPNVSRAWFIIDGKRRIMMWQDLNGKLCCNCGAYYDGDCEHKKAIREYNGGGNGSKMVNECGSDRARAIQDRLNNTRKDKGNGDAKSPSPPTVSRRRRLLLAQLEISDPFQECELKDIAQVEGRGNGEWAHRLSNGEYVVSYRGVMGLAEKHDIEFELATHDETHTIIAKGRSGSSERVSGKPINGSVLTAGELAKRNAARQLLPFAEIKAIEHKAKLESDFSWEDAYNKCAELAGGKPQVDITINDLVKAGKLRQESPSGYDRTEWLMIHTACEKEASVVRSPKSLNKWSYNSAVFLERCREAIGKVRDGKVAEANEMPSQNSNGKRKLQMSKKLKTWLVESDGSKKEISCREICEKFDSNIVTRLRAGIDSGADLSTVELDD
ncbi:MAG: hypothetical protein E3J73_00455 [Candidatus Bathyarchaeum sp.]|nr:MAG: hypothetical protein E3J73_00455 [Candidatus Bathyarchaeum sp.]